MKQGRRMIPGMNDEKSSSKLDIKVILRSDL